MKKRWIGVMSALAGVFLAGTAQAVIIETNLNLEAATYTGADVISTRLQYGSATFDIVYTLDSLANGSNSFVQANGTSAGVGSDTDIAAHYGTLEGNDGEGMSFTGLVLTNFFANNSGLVREDISDVKFVSLSAGAIGNAQDGVAISFIGHGLTNVNVNLNTADASPVDLTALTNYPASATDLYIKCDNGNSKNRWSFTGVGVSYDVNLGINEPPVADPQSFTMFPGTTISNITLTGSDYEESPLTYTVDDSLLIGTLTGATNVWTYTPAVDYRGVDSFTFTVNDGEQDSAPATVSFNVTNSVPTATEQSVDVYTFGSVDFSLAATDADSGPSNLTYTILSQPSEGTLVINDALPNLTYTPTGSYAGEDAFTFSVFDGLDESETATVTINVLNNPPVADSKIVSTQPGTDVAVTLTGSDLEGNTVTLGVETYPTNGALTGIAPDMLYSPNDGFTGVDTFTYSAYDGMTTGMVATVSISVSADGFLLPFEDLNQVLSNNTLNVGGIPADVIGVSTNVGALTNDYIYSVSFDGADFDGDSSNDTLTFDVLVEAWSFGTISCSLTNGPDIATNGTVVVGETNSAVVIGGGGWGVGAYSMAAGQTLQFTVQNVAVSLTDANQSGVAEQTGFFSTQLTETGNSYGHQTVIGVGTELLESRWNVNGPLSGFNTGTDPLYISQATVDGPTANPQRWVVGGVDLGFSVSLVSADIPPVSIGVSGSDLVFSWEGGGTYDVLSTDSVAFPDWGVAIPDATSPVSAPIGTEAVLFFKLSE